MESKASKLISLLCLVEDDKARMGTFIDPRVLKRFKELPDWEKISKENARKSRDARNEEDRLTYANMALGYVPEVLNALKDEWEKEHGKEKDANGKKKSNPFSRSARSLAKDQLKREKHFNSSEHDVYPAKETEHGDSNATGFERAASPNKDVTPGSKEAIINLINAYKKRFNTEAAQKALSVYLIQGGVDEVIPSKYIPYYHEVSKLMKKMEDDGEIGVHTKAAGSPSTVITKGLGINPKMYHQYVSFLRDHSSELQHESFYEAFLTGLTSLFGGGKDKEFKLSNLEPMIDIIKRDMKGSKYKSFGLHLQGVTKEDGEDMLKTVPNVRHEYQGDALLIPLDGKTSLNQILKKAIPGKRVVLFGYDSKAQPLRKGWEGFPYKMVTNPTVVGSYSLSTESKAESLKKMFEGFQCQNYAHATLSCGLSEGRSCHWKGFPSIDPADMQRECLDFK